jgi:hypothetical protein
MIQNGSSGSFLLEPILVGFSEICFYDHPDHWCQENKLGSNRSANVMDGAKNPNRNENRGAKNLRIINFRPKS